MKRNMTMRTSLLRHWTPRSLRTRSLRTLSLMTLSTSGLMGCMDSLEPYYGTGVEPSIAGLSVVSQVGSLAGEIVIISGENFGGDPNAVTVVFGNQNARVVSVDDASMTVVVPHGPISGGAVDVAVATAGGQSRLTGGYTYELPSRSPDQLAYITIANDGLSCYAGIYNPYIGGCDGFSLTGETGISARAEALEAVFPNAHIPFSLGKGGFAQGSDISWEAWSVITSPFQINSFDLESATEDQRVDIGEITLTNPALEGRTDCVDYGFFSTYTYNGGDTWTDGPSEGLLYPNVSVAGSSGTLTDRGTCSDENLASGLAVEVSMEELKLCQTDEFEVTNTFVYESDWLSRESFFQAENSYLEPIPVRLNIPNAGIEALDITLPEVAEFNDVDDEFAWILRGGGGVIDADECVDDDDEDRTTDGGDAVFTWQWEPVSVEYETCDTCDLKEVETYVVANVSFFAFSWLGGEGIPMTATITVPDDHNYDRDTGLSSLEMPAWVLYSMPTSDLDFGFSGGGVSGTTWGGWGDPTGLNYGYLVVTIDRITEFTLPASPMETPIGTTVSGDIVLAYSTGDIGYFIFNNPLDFLDENECADCVDNDGDGWTDEDDPDCEDQPFRESQTRSNYTCNDGRDNDGDGLIDWEDDDCPDGFDGEVDDCSNGDDDDGDGWIDEDDPDCIDDIYEDSPTSEFSCNDGLDNDSDGWIDVEDLACTVGSDSEDDGLSDAACNDGIDNDGHGDVDAEDLYCLMNGADAEVEESLSGDCADKTDNDGDGYVDGQDPDCDLGAEETYQSTAEFPASAPLITLPCYNGTDDDSDGATDAEDPGCAPAGVPDGFAPDEAAADAGVTDCTDAADNDADGWIDGDDPDCSVGTTEVGFDSSYACNDDTDNDIDTLTDSDDPDCVDGFDNDEAN